MGRYTSEEIKDQFGAGKKAIRSLKKVDPELQTEMLTAFNMAHVQAQQNLSSQLALKEEDKLKEESF